MFCAISGTIPEEPVVSRKSGLLFEKRLIEKALNASGGKCPETGEELGAEDLIEVKTSGKTVEPVKASATSFAGLLNHLQSEWDSIILENQHVKQQLSKTRQELAHALYHYDASTRVIKKLMDEKEDLKKAMEQSLEDPRNELVASSGKRKHGTENSTANGASAGDDSTAQGIGDEGNPTPAKRRKESGVEATRNEEGDKGGDNSAAVSDDVDYNANMKKPNADIPEEPKCLPEEMVEEVKQKMTSLLSARKARRTPDSLEKPKAFESFVSVAQFSNPSEGPSNSILFINESRVAVGSLDGKISVVDSKSLKLEETKEQTTSAINSLCTMNSSSSLFVSGHEDGCVRVWESKPEGKESFVMKRSSAIVDVGVHPNDRLLLSCSRNGAWSWMDLIEQKVLASGVSSESESKLCCGAVHPDGAIFGVGSKRGSIELFDVRVMKTMALFRDERFTGDYGVSDLNMSENGYYMASAINGTVAIWDLRRQKVTREFEIEEKAQPISVKIDYSGIYGCAVSKNKHVIFSTKKKAGVLAEFSYNLPNSDVSASWNRPGVAWDVDAKAVLTGHTNGAVERYSLAE